MEKINKVKKFSKKLTNKRKEWFKMKELKLKIEGMVCGGCENRVKSALALIDGVESVDANHNTGIVTVKSKEDLDISQIKEKIIDIGYEIVEG